MPIFGWVLLLGGLFMVAAARFGWYESGILRDLDWFDQVPMIGRVGGGRRRGFYMLGAFAVALGTFLLFWGR